MEWTEEAIGRLRTLWTEGHSTAEISRRLGVSKNAVVGKAHRLDLPSRPSPIRRDGPRRPAPRRIAGPTLPPLSSTVAPAIPPTQPPPSSPSTIQESPATVSGANGHTAATVSSKEIHHTNSHGVGGAPEQPARRFVPTPRPYVRTVDCLWPIGEPGTPSFHFCGAEAVPNKPYCEPHAQVAYVKVRDRREDSNLYFPN